MNFTKQQLKNELKDYAIITIGAVIYALAWVFFLLPYNIVSGGVTGLSAIVFYATGIPLQYTYFFINAILLVFALKILGFRFMTKTIYATIMLFCILKGNSLGTAYSGGWLFVTSFTGISPSLLFLTGFQAFRKSV